MVTEHNQNGSVCCYMAAIDLLLDLAIQNCSVHLYGLVLSAMLCTVRFSCPFSHPLMKVFI